MPLSFTCVPSVSMKHTTLQDVLKSMKDKEVVRDSKHGFTRGKFCLTDHIAVISDGLSASVDKAPSNIMHLDFC